MAIRATEQKDGLDSKGGDSSVTSNPVPAFLRLPPQGVPCPLTGLSRAKMSQLVLPNERNGFSPPVRSVKVAPAKGRKGRVRLVNHSSLVSYLNSLEGGAR